jgi:hypothetical protein
MINGYKLLVGVPEEISLWDTGVDGKIILKYIVEWI